MLSRRQASASYQRSTSWPPPRTSSTRLSGRKTGLLRLDAGHTACDNPDACRKPRSRPATPLRSSSTGLPRSSRRICRLLSLYLDMRPDQNGRDNYDRSCARPSRPRAARSRAMHAKLRTRRGTHPRIPRSGAVPSADGLAHLRLRGTRRLLRGGSSSTPRSRSTSSSSAPCRISTRWPG